MKKIRVMTTLISSSLVTYVLAATTLTPNQNNSSGQLPSVKDDLTFNLSNGNWVKEITLPETAKEGALLIVNSTADYESEIGLRQIGINTSNVLELKTGDQFQFKYNAGHWVFSAPKEASFNPNQHGNHIPMFQAKHADYILTDQSWTDIVYLPTAAQDGQILVIQSRANKSSRINPQGILFSSSYILNRNDTYIFQFDQSVNKWLPLSVPIHRVSVTNGDSAQLERHLQRLTAPKTEVKLSNGAWLPSIKLPQWANDRDRIMISSKASWPSEIENENTNTSSTMKLHEGNYYEFMYVADKAHWVLMSAPKTVLSAKSAAKGFRMQSPVVEIQAEESQWAAVVNLPQLAQTGDKVIVSNTSNTAYKVVAGTQTATVNSGDRLRFIFESEGWKPDSDQADLLIVNSPVINEILGETAAKIQAREALRLSNESLENSNAKLYFRQVGYLNYRTPGTTLKDAISLGRSDQTLQTERQRLGADAIYIITDHDGCGLAWVNKKPNKNMMIAAHHYDCGVTAMRHELGHNLGLHHRKVTNSTGSLQPFARSIMGGNQFGLFASPNLYNPEYGVRLTEVNTVDEVGQINKNAQAIAQFAAAMN